MARDENSKVTFYADADVKEKLDQLDPGTKSHTINGMLRKGFEGGSSVNEQIGILEAKIKKLEAESQHDSHAIGAIRQWLIKNHGPQVGKELEIAFNEILMGQRIPTR